MIREAEETEGLEGETEESSLLVEELQKSLASTRLALGRRNRAVASLQRQLDQVPTRAELAQYQRRFMELYSQGMNVAWYQPSISLKVVLSFGQNYLFLFIKRSLSQFILNINDYDLENNLTLK